MLWTADDDKERKQNLFTTHLQVTNKALLRPRRLVTLRRFYSREQHKSNFQSMAYILVVRKVEGDHDVLALVFT